MVSWWLIVLLGLRKKTMLIASKCVDVLINAYGITISPKNRYMFLIICSCSLCILFWKGELIYNMYDLSIDCTQRWQRGISL